MATVTRGSTGKLEEILGEDASNLLAHKSETVPKAQLHLPGPDFVDRVWKDSDRPTRVLRSLQSMFDHGRLAGTGYLSILPVDQGIEHAAGASFAPNPIYFDGGKIVELAIEGGCNAVASTFGVLGSVARKHAHRIPFICKLNHNELLTYPNHYDQILFGTVKEAWEMGAVAVGATIYFGSAESDRQLQEIAFAFHAAHELGMATVLWCYVRNNAFKKDGVNYETAADLTGQANHLGVSIEADFLEKLWEVSWGPDWKRVMRPQFKVKYVTARGSGTAVGVRYESVKLDHGTMGSIGYRIHVNGKVVAYSGDTEATAPLDRLVDGADVAIVEATGPGDVFSHMSWEAAASLKRRHPKTRFLFNHLYAGTVTGAAKDLQVLEV